MYPQDDEIGVLEVLEIKILFAAQPWWTDLGFSSAGSALVVSLQGY